ncbi:hypothetical protein MLD38_030894 [Melastoma candidum]|uniref:Uncharacterized protein n=1 Tax=Melastoma candidum TaxID=119954 RepID=A0ACB9MP88_9MYRT|nr:hypothetical protein MLD38_030894 [Melastoma candidum]
MGVLWFIAGMLGASAEGVLKRLTYDEIQSKTYMEVRELAWPTSARQSTEGRTPLPSSPASIVPSVSVCTYVPRHFTVFVDN